MAEHDDQDDLDKGGELMRDHALIAEVAEGGADVEGENGDDDALHDFQHDVLKFLQQAAGDLAFGPDRREADQQSKGQCTHDGHDLRDVELENNRRQIPKPFHIRHDGEMRDQGITGCGAHERRADGADIGEHDRHAQHTGSVIAHAGDGRGNKADDDQRNTEHDELAENKLKGNNDLHCALAEDLTKQNADGQSNKQAEGKTGKELFHDFLLCGKKDICLR